MNKMESIYSAPQMKIIEVSAQQVICGSGDTERYSMSSNSYDDDDFE